MATVQQLSVSSFIERIPTYVTQIAEKLQDQGFEAYLVGGSIRDVLLGKQPDDYDIATDAHPEDIQEIFPKSIAVGAQFGTIVVVAEDEEGERFDVEVTTFRDDADYVDGRWPSKVSFTKTIGEDLARRDFTINAIALNLQKFDEKNISIHDILVDPYFGLRDLEAELIRAVRDPMERFSEDGLRAVRACRLASQLDYTIEEKTFESIKQTNHVTEKISVERFRDEFQKILLRSKKPSIGLKLLHKAGILEIFIPELLEGIDINQPQFHVEDVFEHSLRACDVAEDSIKLAALFHDIGKPRTRSEDKKGIHFYGHDQVGADMTQEILKRLRFPNEMIKRVVNLIRWHMFYYPSGDWRKENLGAPNKAPEDHHLDPLLEADEHNPKELGWSDGAVRRLIKNVGGDEAVEELLKLRIADATANPKSPFNPKEIDALAKRIASVRAQDMVLKIEDLAISGHDLMSNFNLEPGPILGNVLHYLLERVLDEPLFNKKVDLLRLTKQYLDEIREIDTKKA